MPVALSTARTSVREQLQESSAAQWTDAELNRWINEGCRDISRRTECLQTTGTQAVTGADPDYTLPTNLIRLNRVEWVPTGSSNVYALQYRDYGSMDELWLSSKTISGGDPIFYTLWGSPPTITIQLWPVPSSNGTLTFYYYRFSTDSTGAGQTTNLDIPEGWEDAVYHYAEYQALRRDRDPRWQEAKALYEEKLVGLVELTSRWTDQNGTWVSQSAFGLPNWLTDPFYD